MMEERPQLLLLSGCVSMPKKSFTVQANQLSSAEIQMSLKLIKCLKAVHTSILSRFLIYLLNWFTLLLVQLVPLISRSLVEAFNKSKSMGDTFTKE